MPSDLALERSALRLSLVVTTVLGVGALVWGLVGGSGAILFDGVYMLAGIGLIGVSMGAARLAAQPPSQRYPFGRHAATPLAVLVQGGALLGMMVYGALDAVATIRAGGSETGGISLLLYGLVTALASIGVVLALRPAARSSSLAAAEVVSWRAGALLSLVVALGGGLALLAQRAGWTAVVGYVDPVLVLIACSLVAPLAVSLVRDGLRELLEAAPPAPVLAAVDDVVAGVRSAHPGLPEPLVRATLLGRRLYAEIDFVVEPGVWFVEDEDRVRRAVQAGLEPLGHELWLNVELTTDPALAAD